MKTKLLFIFLFFGLSFTKAQTISTIAGTGFGAPNAGGYVGDNGPATTAELYWPFSITLCKGNIYVADTYNRRIRKVSVTGVITTVAGGGFSGLGDGGQATAAGLWNPTQALFDAIGNMYIVDAAHNRIRIVNTTGIINTVVGNGQAGFSGDGGPATAAQLHGPQYAAFDAGGNLYIADVANNRIRKVNTGGIISTIAGTGTAGYGGDGGQATNAQLNGPDGVTLDASGNLYIADYSNNRIRMVNTAGIITTIVGTGVAGFSGDGGPATAAQLHGPNDGTVFDALGNFYIPDALNNRIRKVNTAGIISTIAGNGIAGYSGDGGPALAAALNYPGGVALDSSLCNLYIADLYNDRIRLVTNAEVTILVNSPSVCVGDTTTFTLTASGAANYTWTPNINLNTNLGSTVIATSTASINYTVMSTLGSCHNSATSSITINPLPTITVSTPTICVGNTGTLTATGASTYTWSTGADTNSIVVSPSVSSTYTVVGTSAASCVGAPTVGAITVTPYPMVSISGVSAICIGQHTTLTASGAKTYTWSTGDSLGSLTVSPTKDTGYTVIGTTGLCSTKDSISITVNNWFNFTLPNIVTPNNDDINDYIDFGKYEFSTLQLEIYNRWGTKIFESSSPTCVWKPTEDDGTYFYTAQYAIKCSYQEQSKSLKGFITVVR